MGKRGEGKWKRISWEQALPEIADTTLDALKKEWQADPSTLRPRVFFQVGGNIVRRIRGYNR